MASREDNIYFARLAEQGERYEDMIKYMKDVSQVSTELYTMWLINLFRMESSQMKKETYFLLHTKTR